MYTMHLPVLKADNT